MHIEKAENINRSDEALRLAKLKYYDILDTPAESAFDQITQLAAAIFDVPNAGICFRADEDVFVKSQIGLTITVPPNDDDLSFFVAAPIKSPEGYMLGQIYVADNKPQTPTNKQLNMLTLLADMVLEKLESRISIRRTFRAYDNRLHVLVHDLKNPMTTILLQSELLGRIPGIDEKSSVIAGKINTQSKRMIDNLNGILSSARKEPASFKPEKAILNLKEVLEQVKFDLNLTLKRKNQTILIDIEDAVEIFGDITKLKVAFSQLVDNAIKFSPKGKEIKISHQTAENEVTIAIKDGGVGLSKEDLDKIFLKFSRLNAIPTDNENIYGLGLITASAMIDIHKGKLWAESDGENLGTTFYVTLPIK
jgi:signal transduction histidine kinase